MSKNSLKLNLIFFLISLALQSMASAKLNESWQDFTCLYANEVAFSNVKTALARAEYGLPGTVHPEADHQGYQKKLSRIPFFKNWPHSDLLAGYLNLIYKKVPEFAEHLVSDALQFKYAEQSLANQEKPFGLPGCGDIKSPISSSADQVFLPVIHIGKVRKQVVIDREIVATMLPIDQVNLVLNVLLNIYTANNFAKDIYLSKASWDWHSSESQFLLRYLTSLMMDPQVSANSLIGRLNRTFDGRRKVTTSNESFLWLWDSAPKERVFGDPCYSHGNLNLPDSAQCFLEVPQYFKPGQNQLTDVIRLQKVYSTSAKLNEIAKSCSSFESDYTSRINQAMRDLDRMNRTVYGWLGSNDIRKICDPIIAKDQSIKVFEFMNPREGNFCGMWSYANRTVVVEGLLMNGYYGRNTDRQSTAIMTGGEYAKIAHLKHPTKGQVSFDWSKSIDWDRFVQNSEDLRNDFKRFSENQFRCNVDINKAVFLSGLRGVK